MNSYYGKLINNEEFVLDLILDTVNKILRMNIASAD
jgi:hypothetical protein